MGRPPEDLVEAARRVFTARATDFGLDGSRIEVRYVLNPGGFVNTSLQVRDGTTGLHVKLATTAEARSALRRWYELDTALRRHGAPPILDWIEVGGAGGLVFPLLDGEAPGPRAEVIGAVLDRVRELWADRELARRLAQGTPPTAGERYLQSYHDRFTEDLAAIALEPPPFLAEEDLSWMREEVAELERRVGESPSFQEPVTSPTHGDLWLNNVLWRDRESWWLLDWDDLQLGDPAMDVAMLVGPTASDLRPLKTPDRALEVLDETGGQRLGLLARASLLDWVIDPLADWIEAESAPVDPAAIRPGKERIHREAVALYRELYQT